MSLTVSDTTKLIPALLGVDQFLLKEYIDIVTTEADLLLNNIFASPLNTVSESNLINYDTQNIYGSDFISISAWQPTGLAIKKTCIDNQNLEALTESPLVLGQDYVLWYGWKGKKIPGKTLPVTAIRLLDCSLKRNEILRVSGTYGWQEGYPGDVKLALANVIANLVAFNNNPDSLYTSGADRVKDLSTEIEFSGNMAERLREEARNFLSDPAFSAILNKYLYPLEQTVIVV